MNLYVNISFEEFLKYSVKLREEYANSLSRAERVWRDYLPLNKQNISIIYEIIYSKSQGTKRELKDQRLMDFVPGYRLIHIAEMEKEKKSLDKILKNHNIDEMVILPLLTNYS